MAPVTQRLLVTVIVPVQIGGENRYALARSPEQRMFARLVAANELPAGWQAVISDATHRIIEQSGNHHTLIGQELPLALRHRPEPGVFKFIDLAGRPSLGASTKSELTGWETAVWAPKAVLEAPVRVQWRTLGAIALLAIALVAASAFWLGRTTTRSVGHAARTAVALGEGGPMPVSETPVAEVDTLMAELREAAARRQAAEHDLQASKDQLQLAFDATKLGWWRYDPLRDVGSGDARFKVIFDVIADEVSIEDLMKRVHPYDVERFWANRQAALDPVNPTPYVHHEYRVRRRDGTVRWVEANALAYFEGAGAERRAVSLGGTVQDITERKEWKGVYIADLARAQLAHFADLIGSRIAMHGPKLRLNPASAQAVGLVLHELATNAGKYGALSTDTGRVDICWATDGDTFTMSWVERDGPPVSAPKRRGFGTLVMQAMTERSLTGKVELLYPPSGVTWRLTCPAANVPGPNGDNSVEYGTVG
jgi:PAS domain S-box-containing protein